jgi:anti-sigma factor RsiW
MNCPLESEENSALLLAYSSGRLDAESAVQVLRHLDTCPACQSFVQSQAAVWESLDDWHAAPVSADFDRRLHERIERQMAWWDRLLRPVRPLLSVRGLPIAAAAGVLIMAGVLLERPTAVLPPAIPQSAQAETLQPDQVQHAVNELEMLNQFDRLMHADAGDPNAKM